METQDLSPNFETNYKYQNNTTPYKDLKINQNKTNLLNATSIGNYKDSDHNNILDSLKFSRNQLNHEISEKPIASDTSGEFDNLLHQKNSIIGTMLNNLDYFNAHVNSNHTPEMEKENSVDKGEEIDPITQGGIDKINEEANIFKNLQKHCMFCYTPLDENLSQLCISDDKSKPLCPKHLPCQAVSLDEPLCVECGKPLENGRMHIMDSNLDFCSTECLQVFLPKLNVNCFLCNKVLTKESFGQYCLKLENKNIRQFCSDECLEKFNPLSNYCYQCHKDLTHAKEQPMEFNLLPLNFQNDLTNLKLEDMQTEFFCNQDCLSSFELAQNGKIEQSVKGYCDFNKCAVCSQFKPIGQSFVIPYNSATKGPALAHLCSATCINLFLTQNRAQLHPLGRPVGTARKQTGGSSKPSSPAHQSNSLNTANNSGHTSNSCEYCGTPLTAGRTAMTVLTIQGRPHFFCRATDCAQAYKAEETMLSSNTSHQNVLSKDAIINNAVSAVNSTNSLEDCHWCKTTRYSKDMIMLPIDRGGVLLFCSPNCITLYKLNQNEDDSEDFEGSGDREKKCDNCHKSLAQTPGAYCHFTIAEKDSPDGKPKRFCTFPCMAQYKVAHKNKPSIISNNASVGKSVKTELSLVDPNDPDYDAKNESGGRNNATKCNGLPQSEPRPYRGRGRPPKFLSRPSNTYIHNATSLGTQSQGNNAAIFNKQAASPAPSASQRPHQFQTLMDIFRKSLQINKAASNSTSDSKTSQTISPDDLSNTGLLWPLAPKDVKNKSTSVRPLVRSQGMSTDPLVELTDLKTAATTNLDTTSLDFKTPSSRPFSMRPLAKQIETIDQANQTEEGSRILVPIPIPVPFYIPYPMHAYTSYTPVVLPLPIPCVLPAFIPTTAKTTNEISDYFKELKDKTTEALQKELLQMAQALNENDALNATVPINQAAIEAPARLKPLKGTPGYVAPSAITDNSEAHGSYHNIHMLNAMQHPQSQRQAASQQSLGNVSMDYQQQQQQANLSNQQQTIDGSQVLDPSSSILAANTLLTSLMNNLSTNIQASSLEELYAQMSAATAAGASILNIQSTGSSEIVTGIPIQNADGTMTYASIDASTGTLTPIDPIVIQQHLMELQLQLAAAQQFSSNPASVGNSLTMQQISLDGSANSAGNINSSGAGYIAALSNSHQHLHTHSAQDVTSHIQGQPLEQSSTTKSEFDSITLTNNKTFSGQESSDETNNSYRQTSHLAAIDFSPPYTFTIENPNISKHLEVAYGVGAYKFWVRTKNIEIANHLAAKQAAGDSLEANSPTKTDSDDTQFPSKLMEEDPVQIPMGELIESLCAFVVEILRPDGTPYTSDSIYYFVLGTQTYLHQQGRSDNIFTDTLYGKFTDSLNDVLLKFEPQITTEGVLLSRIDEECLWESMQLGAHSPHVLLNTLLYFNTKYFHLTTLEAHMALNFSHIVKLSREEVVEGEFEHLDGQEPKPKMVQHSFLRYYPQGATHNLDGSLAPYFDLPENKANSLKCPVRLYEFYLLKCPPESKTRTDIFYLLPDTHCSSDSPLWYLNEVLTPIILAKMFNRIFIVKETLESNIAV